MWYGYEYSHLKSRFSEVNFAYASHHWFSSMTSLTHFRFTSDSLFRKDVINIYNITCDKTYNYVVKMENNESLGLTEYSFEPEYSQEEQEGLENSPSIAKT